MVWRQRTKDLRTAQAGTYKYLAGGQWYTINRSTLVGPYKECEDETGDWDEDNPFHSWFWTRKYPVLEGSNASGSRVFSNFTVDGAHAPQVPDYGFSHPNWAEIASDAAARTNPSKPAINIPAFLGELKDLPGLFRSVPDLLRGKGLAYLASLPKKGSLKGASGVLKDAAGANLGYQFGWRPFVSDLIAIADWAKGVGNALAALAQLCSGKSIKRRSYYPLKQSYTDHGTLYTHTLGTTVRHKMETVRYCREWVTTRWSATSATPIPLTDDEALKLALQLAFGINSHGAFAAAWELLPWSRLIDWFWNLGGWFAANGNFLRLSLDSICWCRTTSSITTFTLVQGPDAGISLVGEYSTSSSLKERHPIAPILALLPPLPSLPCLTAGQMSILGSLIAQSRL